MSDVLQVDPRHLGKIPLGQGIARLPNRHKAAFLFSFPPAPLKNTSATDDMVRARYAQWRGTTDEPAVLSPVVLRENDVTLLLDIATHPISTVTERYTRLSWNPNKGNTIKDSILQQKLADFTTVDVGRTRMKILTLTNDGITIVTDHGGTITTTGPGGLEHEFWRSRLRERCENRGYTVTSEHQLENGKRVDLHAQRTDKTFLIEIETGKSTVTENINRAHDHGNLIVFCTNNNARAIAMEDLPPGVTIITPESINTTLNDLLR